MQSALRSFWRRRRLWWPRGVSLAVVVSLLTITTAPIWHHHDHDGGNERLADAGQHDRNGQDKHKPHDDDGCSLCAAVHAPTGDGFSSLPFFKPPPCGELVRWMGAERAAVLWVGTDRASRGPPLQA